MLLQTLVYHSCMAFTREKVEMLNAARLANVMPELAERVRKLIALANAEGHTLLVTQGYRTFAEQDKLFQKRPPVTRARGGQSFHNYGLAADFAFVVRNEISWDDALYQKIGKWAAAANLEWGGNWKFKDMPHVQITGGLTWQRCLALHKTGGRPAVWAEVVKK